MGIRKKFFVLIGTVGVVLLAVSCIGYFMAYNYLSRSITSEVAAVVKGEGNELNGWIEKKGEVAVGVGREFAKVDPAVVDSVASEMFLNVIDGDKEVLDLSNGTETGKFISHLDGDISADVDPRTRPWYKEAKEAGKPVYTEVYENVGPNAENQLVVSVAVPYKDASGKFTGALCEDITLDVLDKIINQVKYRDEGTGVIIDRMGQIIATSGDEEKMSDVKTDPVLGSHYQDMLKTPQGSFEIEKNGETQIFTYTTLETPGWILGISVPKSFIYADLTQMKIVYGILVVVGLLLVTFGGLRFASNITGAIVSLREHADELANGNLTVDDMSVNSDDEIGALTNAFNVMAGNIRTLIKKIAATSQMVAASSEELTASAHQSAEAANNVAGTVTEVATGMENQMQNINVAKGEVDAVYADINGVAQQTTSIADASVATAEAAKHGETMMRDAIEMMAGIEKSVMNSAEVVKKLGENSQQIGQIVDAIASIADQTNLLALNAAIEAARAGEHGRGFAVVAEEVRKLAAQSQESAEQIKERIESIRTDTDRAVTAMQSGTDEVQQGTAAIREVGTQFGDIMEKVSAIKEQMEGINASVQRITSGAMRIVNAVDSIDDVSRKTAEHTKEISSTTEEQSASTEEIASASQSLAQMAVELQEATGEFKI